MNYNIQCIFFSVIIGNYIFPTLVMTYNGFLCTAFILEHSSPRRKNYDCATCDTCIIIILGTFVHITIGTYAHMRIRHNGMKCILLLLHLQLIMTLLCRVADKIIIIHSLYIAALMEWPTNRVSTVSRSLHVDDEINS